MSKMLRERGAVIVDADQIARDIQAPGSAVVVQMAERFGDHIIRDDGSLDRAAVASIVFSDKDALADLNGIVHPAMQAEIEAQIAAQADTDNLVVLDFPLLGENPREGLAATIVVDIPYDLAIERVVEHRAMDPEDARNRVESQMRREDRVALATHVIDNSGDFVDLVAQIDRLWSQLEDLRNEPSDRDGDIEQAADTGQPDEAEQTVWVFGYGSLVSPESMARTIGRVAVRGENYFAATLDGYGRRWNYGVAHVEASWQHDGRRIDDGVIVALGVEASNGERVNGVVASLVATELANLDRREREYDRVDVTDQVTVTDPEGAVVAGPIVTYVPRPAAVAHYQRARDEGRAGIRRTYWDLVDEAFRTLGADQLDEYRATPKPDVPIVDVVDARER